LTEVNKYINSTRAQGASLEEKVAGSFQWSIQSTSPRLRKLWIH